MKLFLEPIDVWLFRDGRPFDARSDHRAQSLFPPYPTVMQGILRSHHLVVKGVDLRDQKAIERTVGTATTYPPGFRMRGPFMARRTSEGVRRYFPLPADAVTQENTLRALTPLSPPLGIWTSVPTPQILWCESEGDEIKERWWVREDALIMYLEQGILRLDEAKREGRICPQSALFQRENRLGIGLDDAARTAQEGALYEVEFIRVASGVGLAVDVEGLEGWPERGILRAGGEGRGAYFEISDTPAWPEVPDPLPERFKIYLATPAYFEEGWRPKDWQRFFHGRVELVAVALGRYEVLGGFDLATGSHKPARRYVPAGSVYFFQSDGQATLKADLVNQAITDYGAEIGFGQILIGRWEHV
ncbi:MAG: type III-B CRISPR module-associated protein Cmr3 [Anaerolineae bacterium]|nr:type III-B CRISPR module-associated protein Cmr3 [Anaerolineae bacterium]MDW8068809.1 type III-B CRISPR module-associated protein Cmr3 [Anaerolineae bacterium]